MAKTLGNRVLLEFFYDVISPYSWLAFEILCRYKPLWNVDLTLKPVFLGGIMKESGNTAPAMVPNKAIYMGHDIKRLNDFYKVPVTIPENFADIIFNKGSLKAQRFITAVDLDHPEHTENLSRALWTRVYKMHEDITEPESFKQAGKEAGLSEVVINDALSKMSNPDVKQKLLHTTQQALNYGAFGVPATVGHINGKPELFFGADRLDLLAHMLGEKWMGPVPNLDARSQSKL